MKSLLSLFTAVCCVGALSAQTTVLSEDFDANVVPPAGWTTQNLNASISAGWVSDLNGQAYHADESGVGMCDDILATPDMDLTGLTEAYVHFNTFMGWVSYLDSQSLDVSTDGGATFTMVWSDLGMNNMEDTVDISAYAGQSSVMVGFHYVGDYAHSTTIDNVVVAEGSGGGGLTYAITPMTAGSPATFSVTGADVNANCIIGYSLAGAGPINTAYGVVDMTPPISRLPTLTTDGNGDASLTLTVPANASGVTLYTQALANGVLTNSLAETVQ